jgi:ABC-type bacteriocin/lantibiotic exporter with double-glycine peptidase domain
MTPVKRFLGLLNQDRKDLFYLYIYAIFNGIINLSLPIGIQAIIGFVLAGRLSVSWIILTIVVTLGIAIAGGFQIMQLYIVEILQRKLFARAALDFAYRIPRFKSSAMTRYYAPELVNRFFDTVSVQKSLSKVLVDFSTSILQIIFGLILLSLYHPIFIAFGLVLIVILWLIVYLSARPGLDSSLDESNSKYEMAHWLTELARGLTTFKLNSHTDINLTKTNSIVGGYLYSRKRHFKILLRQYASIVGLKTLVTAALLIVGALLLIQNSITIGQFVASEIVIILILNSSEKFIMSMEAVYDIVTSVEKLGVVTDVELEEDTSEGIILTEIQKGIRLEFDNLQLIGLHDQLPIGHALSQHIDPSANVCISGKQGSGKSNLLRLLSTSVDNYTGDLLYDGIPLQNLNIDRLRGTIGCVFNDQELFYGTVIENITLGRKEIDEKQVIEMCQLLGLDRFVNGLPNGYREILLNSEMKLSKTDRVKLLIARALAGNPRLLLLEDLFSDLEAGVQEELLDTVWKKSIDATVVIVTNNEAFKKRCDVNISMN